MSSFDDFLQYYAPIFANADRLRDNQGGSTDRTTSYPRAVDNSPIGLGGVDRQFIQQKNFHGHVPPQGAMFHMDPRKVMQDVPLDQDPRFQPSMVANKNQQLQSLLYMMALQHGSTNYGKKDPRYPIEAIPVPYFNPHRASGAELQRMRARGYPDAQE